MIGELIKATRKKLRVNQSFISGSDMAQNNLSMIESGKIVLTSKSAKSIYIRLHEASWIKGIPIYIEDEFRSHLILDREMKNFIQANKYIEELDCVKSEIAYDRLLEIRDLASKKNLCGYRSITLLDSLSKYFIASNKLLDAFECIYEEYKQLLAYENLKLVTDKFKACIHEIVYVGNLICEHKKVIEVLKSYYSMHLEHDLDVSQNLFYNIALQYKKLNDYSSAEVWLNKLLSSSKEFTKAKARAYILLGNIAYEESRFTEALAAYLMLVEKPDEVDLDDMILAHSNIVHTNTRLRSDNELLRRSVEYLKIVVSKTDSQIHMDQVKLSLAKAKYLDGELTLALDYFDQFIDYCIEHRKYYVLLDACIESFEIIINLMLVDEVVNKLDNIDFDQLSNIETEKLTNLELMIEQFYLDTNQIESLKSIHLKICRLRGVAL